MQKIYWEGREKKNNNRRVAVSAWARNNKDMSKKQGLCSFSLGMGWDGTFQGGDW